MMLRLTFDEALAELGQVRARRALAVAILLVALWGLL